jgi:molybdenum cofactor biosynthesis protein B
MTPNMSHSTQEHRADAPESIRCAVITVSDSRTLDTDTGGAEVIHRLENAGHVVKRREIVPDEPAQIGPLLEQLRDDDEIDAILLTGGTGIAGRDQTYETVAALLDKTLPGYGELFRMLSYEEVGAATILSRTVGGLAGRTVLLTMPGSPAAVQLAMGKIIVPELRHLVREAQRD